MPVRRLRVRPHEGADLFVFKLGEYRRRLLRYKESIGPGLAAVSSASQRTPFCVDHLGTYKIQFSFCLLAVRRFSNPSV